MDFEFLAQADTVTIQLEKAKRALEAAKMELESAKKAYDELLGQADDRGIPKAKLKKLTEDRIQSLFDSGLLEFAEALGPAREPKPKKVKPPKAPKLESESAEVNESEALEVASPS